MVKLLPMERRANLSLLFSGLMILATGCGVKGVPVPYVQAYPEGGKVTKSIPTGTQPSPESAKAAAESATGKAPGQ